MDWIRSWIGTWIRTWNRSQTMHARASGPSGRWVPCNGGAARLFARTQRTPLCPFTRVFHPSDFLREIMRVRVCLHASAAWYLGILIRTATAVVRIDIVETLRGLFFSTIRSIRSRGGAVRNLILLNPSLVQDAKAQPACRVLKVYVSNVRGRPRG